MEIKEIRDRLSLIEKLANSYNVSFKEIKDYVEIANKICIFPFFNSNSDSLRNNNIFLTYNKIFAIQENEDKCTNYGVIKFIDKKTLIKLIELKSNDTKRKIISYINNDFNDLFDESNTNKEIKINKTKHDFKKGININPLNATYNLIDKHCYYSEEFNQYILLMESKSYDRKKFKNYWYSLHQYQIEMLRNNNSFILFQFKDCNDYICIPFKYIEKRLSKFNKTSTNKETYYHILLDKFDNTGYYLRIPNQGREDVNYYLNKIEEIKDEDNNYRNTVIKIKTNELKTVSVKHNNH